MRYQILKFIIFCLLAVTGCKTELELHANTEILRFSYTDKNGDEMQAPVYGDTIYVYWPPLQEAPARLKPTVLVHESATVTPASEVEIELKEGAGYVVKAENGLSKSYYLKVITNQPYPVIRNVQNINAANGKRYWVNTRQLIFTGDNLLFDGMNTNVWAQSPDGTKIPVTIVANTGARLTVSAPPLGRYRIFFEVGERELEYFYEIEVIEPFVTPSITAPTEALSVKRGGTFTLSGTLVANMTSVTMGDYSVQNPLEIVSAEDNSVQLRVPDDFPIGSNVRIVYIYSGGEYFNTGTSSIYLSRGIAVIE